MSAIVNHTCPNCNNNEVALMQTKESEHLDQGIFYKIVQKSFVCKKNCWHSWDEYERVILKNFNIDDRLKVKYLRKEEIINPQDINVEGFNKKN